MLKQNVVVSRELDLHQAALLVQAASRYQSQVYISVDEKRANAKSMMGLVALGLQNGLAVEVSAEGPDEAEAVAGLAAELTKK